MWTFDGDRHDGIPILCTLRNGFILAAGWRSRGGVGGVRVWCVWGVGVLGSGRFAVKVLLPVSTSLGDAPNTSS